MISVGVNNKLELTAQASPYLTDGQDEKTELIGI